MQIYSDEDLKKMSKQFLINILDWSNIIDDNFSYNEKYILKVKKDELIDIIKYKTSKYIDYYKLCDDMINNCSEKITKKQFKIYQSIFLFLFGRVDKNKIIDELNKIYIPDISKLILSKLSYVDYPKIDIKIGLLTGDAGTGKTYIVSDIILKLSKIIDKQGGNIQILAPTNKALKVIKNKICNGKLNVDILMNNIYFQTISKFLEQCIEYNEDGKILYKTKINIDKPLYQQIKCIIIDEASMISKSNWDDLNKYCFSKLNNIKILLIGDECQLPPVNEETSVVFNIECKKFKLTEIVRTSSKEISNIYKIFRELVVNKENMNTVYDKCNNCNNFKYITSFKDELSNFDVNNDKIIAYSNNSVDKYNGYIRDLLFNNPKEKYVIGEKVIFGSSTKIANINDSVIEAKYMYSSDEATIINVQKIYLNTNFIYKSDFKFKLNNFFLDENFEVYNLQLHVENGDYMNVYKVQEHDIIHFEEYFKNVFNKIKTFSKNKNVQKEDISKLWDIFYTIKNTINSPIKYSYALTIYKSQGSTFNKIFVDLEDINMCIKDKRILSKAIYTAITRASQKIYCYKNDISNYHKCDLIQFPYLKKYNKINNLKIYDILKDGQNIIYTKNEYLDTEKRKIVKARIDNINLKKIIVSNTSFMWELKITDDILIYL